MTDRELERQLRDYFRTEGGDEHASRDLLARVSAIPETAPVVSPQIHRAWLLAAAVLLLIALLAAAMVVGSSLLPQNPLLEGVVPTPTSTTTPSMATPTPTPAPSTTPSVPTPGPTLGRLSLDKPYPLSLPGFGTAVSIEGCDTGLPDRMVASLSVSLPIAGRAFGSTASVWDDGLVLIANYASPDQPWSRRRLSGQGLDRLLAELVSPDLPGCRRYDLGSSVTRGMRLIVRGSPGVYSIDAESGTDLYNPSVTTTAQAAAIDTLQAALADPDLGLGAGAWVDAWSTYVSDTWRVQVDLTEGGGAPLTEQVALPDGTPLLQVGADDPTAAERGVEGGARCAIVDHETARALLAQLPGSAIPPGGWDFSNANVQIYPVLAWLGGCPTTADVTPSPTPPPMTTTIAPSGTDVCAFLSPEQIQTALDDPKLATSAEAVAGFEGWPECQYRSQYGGGMLQDDPREGILFVDQLPVMAGQATDVAARLYGDGAVTTLDVAGHQVFYNGCAPDTDPHGCGPSLAISAEPDFVVLVWRNGSRDDLLALAAALIARMDGGPLP